VVDPSGDRDGIPNVVLEAMAIGVPVVATDAGGIAEVVRDGETGFLAEGGSVESLAAKLREALAMDAGNADITGRARALIDREFSLDRTVSTLEGILRSGDA
jgi:glycosyltransferase involved in cell wall biosynthesis